MRSLKHSITEKTKNQKPKIKIKINKMVKPASSSNELNENRTKLIL